MAPWSFLKFLRDQWRNLPVLREDLSEKTVVVVGANVGLGFEAAKHFAAMKPRRLILACRNLEKGEAAMKDIKMATGCESMAVWQIDLADFDSIKAFADRFVKEGGGRLDYLLENAGIGTYIFEETKYGWERTLQINHLGTVHLALRLLPIIANTPATSSGPRITVVSSEAHFFLKKIKEAGRDNILNTLNSKEHSTWMVMEERYSVTKLFNIFFVRAFASRLHQDSPIAINAVNPGLCHSAITREFVGIRKYMDIVIRFLTGRSTEMGSRTLVHAMLGGTQKEVQGRYLNACRVEEESDYILSPEGSKVEDRVWNETLDVLKKQDPQIEEIIAKYFS